MASETATPEYMFENYGQDLVDEATERGFEHILEDNSYSSFVSGSVYMNRLQKCLDWLNSSESTDWPYDYDDPEEYKEELVKSIQLKINYMNSLYNVKNIIVSSNRYGIYNEYYNNYYDSCIVIDLGNPDMMIDPNKNYFNDFYDMGDSYALRQDIASTFNIYDDVESYHRELNHIIDILSSKFDIKSYTDSSSNDEIIIYRIPAIFNIITGILRSKNLRAEDLTNDTLINEVCDECVEYLNNEDIYVKFLKGSWDEQARGIFNLRELYNEKKSNVDPAEREEWIEGSGIYYPYWIETTSWSDSSNIAPISEILDFMSKVKNYLTSNYPDILDELTSEEGLTADELFGGTIKQQMSFWGINPDTSYYVYMSSSWRDQQYIVDLGNIDEKVDIPYNQDPDDREPKQFMLTVYEVTNKYFDPYYAEYDDENINEFTYDLRMINTDKDNKYNTSNIYGFYSCYVGVIDPVESEADPVRP